MENSKQEISNEFEYNKDEPIKPVQKTIRGKRMVAIAGTGLFELPSRKDIEEKRRKTEDNKNLKEINKKLEGQKKKDKSSDKQKTKSGEFTRNLAGSAKEGLEDAIQPLIDTLNPTTYIKMLGDIPGVTPVVDAIKASRKVKSSENKKEDEEDDKVEEEQKEVGYEILENNEEHKSSLESVDNDFDKLLNLTETIKETLVLIKEQGADRKLTDKENKNERKRTMRGIAGAAGAGGGGSGGSGGSGSGEGGEGGGGFGMDDAVNTFFAATLLKGLAKKIPGVGLLMRGGRGLKGLIGKGLIRGKGLIGKGLSKVGLSSGLSSGLLTKIGMVGAKTAKPSYIAPTIAKRTGILGLGKTKPYSVLDDAAKQSAKLTKSRRAGLAVRNASKSKNLLKARHLLKAKTLAQISNPIGWATLVGEVGVESWIRQTEAQTQGLEESLGQGFEIRDGKKFDRKTGLEIDDKTALDSRIKELGLDPEGEKAGKLRRKTRGFKSLKVNEQMISDAVSEALEFRKSGEDQEANAKMQAAVELLKARKKIVQYMGFDDYKKAMNAYTLNFSDIGRKIAALGGKQGKWNIFEQEDRGHFRDLDKAFENIEKTSLRVGLDAVETEDKLSESKNRNRKPTITTITTITPDVPIRIDSSPNTSGIILSETNTVLQNNQSELNRNGGGGGQVAINAPTSSNTTNVNNNISNGRGDSRMNESAFNKERVSEGRNNYFN